MEEGKEEMEVEVGVVVMKLGVVVVLVVEVMVVTVEAGMEEVLEIIAISCLDPCVSSVDEV